MGSACEWRKGLNRVMKRQGKVLDDRYHGHILRTPTEVRRAREYLLQNARRHYGRGGRGSVYVVGGGDRAGYVLDAAVVLGAGATAEQRDERE